MRIDVAGVPGVPGRANEDFVAVAVPASGFGGVAVLLDGVTPPPDGRTGCVHSVSWFTARLGGALVELAGTRPDLDLAGCLAGAITRTAEAHGPACDLSHARTPQATVSAVRWDDERVEYLVLSDAAALLRNGDGTVTPVLDGRLDELLRRPDLRARRVEQRALPLGSPERAAVTRVLGDTLDALRNVDGGFFTAAADPAVAGHAVTGVRPRGEVRAVALASDGVTRYTEVLYLGDWADLLTALADEGAEAVVGRVRAAEAADPECRTFPRGKPFDDASVVYVGF